jgi:hypothetical protein
MDRFWTGFGVGIGLLGIAIAIVLWAMGAFQPQQLPEARITAIHFNNHEITELQPSIEAPRVITVVGESTEVPGDWSVWLCVFPIDVQRYYPQYGPVSNDGSWQRADICLGRENTVDIGKIFIISLVVANADATKQLNRYAQDVLIGMEELPCGAVICDQIIVIRSE